MMEVGVDIVDISRIRAIHARYGVKFLERIMTEAEISQCLSKPDPVASIAGRFAAKEAVSKALGTGMSEGLTWKSIEVLNDSSGKPVVRLWVHGRPSAEDRIKISISHDRGSAVAVAIMGSERMGSGLVF